MTQLQCVIVAVAKTVVQQVLQETPPGRNTKSQVGESLSRREVERGEAPFQRVGYIKLGWSDLNILPHPKSQLSHSSRKLNLSSSYFVSAATGPQKLLKSQLFSDFQSKILSIINGIIFYPEINSLHKNLWGILPNHSLFL